jgi:hypothetical protein
LDSPVSSSFGSSIVTAQGDIFLFDMSLTRAVTLAIALVMGACTLWSIRAVAQAPAAMTLEIEDYVAMPITGKLVGAETHDPPRRRSHTMSRDTPQTSR